MQATASGTVRRGSVLGYIRGAMEACWLAAAGLTPLAMTTGGLLLDPVQAPKVALLRGLVAVMLALWAWEWALTVWRGRREGADPEEGGVVRRGPGKWAVGAALFVVAATAASAALSPVWHVSVWGSTAGSDGYSLHSIAAYVALFLVVATHLRRPEQLRRLLLVVAAAAVAAGAYSIAQHFGFDPFQPSRKTQVRAPSTFGNPIFAGSFFLMALPLVLAVAAPRVTRWRPGWQPLLAVAAVSIVLLALVFSLSRGPWVGAVVALGAFLALAGACSGRRVARQAVILLALAAGVAAAVTMLPVANPERGAPRLDSVAERASSISEDIATGDLAERTAIWKASLGLAVNHPWVEGAESRGMPPLSHPAWRPVVGYGPDMFPYAFPLSGQPLRANRLPNNAHNFFVQTLVELGALGLAAYVALFVVLAIAGIRLLRRARRGGYPAALSLALVAVLAALAGRVIEQMVGLPRVSDMTLFWLLAAVLVAFPALAPEAETDPGRATAAPGAAPRRTDVRGLRPVAASLAVLATIALGAILWQTNGRYVSAAALGASARNAFAEGDYRKSVALLERAEGLAPGVPSYSLNKGIVLDGWRRQVADESMSAALLRLAYQETRDALAWNPLEHRLWAKTGEYAWQLARLDPGMQRQAMVVHETMTALMPGYWVARNALAGVYLEFQQPARALGQAGYSLIITGPTKDSAQALFLVGAAYRALDKPTLSAQALEASLRLGPDHPQAPQARRMLAQVSTQLGAATLTVGQPPARAARPPG